MPTACLPLEERQSVIQLVENGNVMPMCFEPAIIFPGKPSTNESMAVETNSPPISLHSSPSSSIGSSCRTRSSTVNRLSYPREFKLMVIECYLTNGQNKYRTCKEFRITKSMLNSWLQKESKIRASKPGSLKASHYLPLYRFSMKLIANIHLVGALRSEAAVSKNREAAL